jgi:hypothetical protein
MPLAAGCGSEGHGETQGSTVRASTTMIVRPALTRPEFVSEVNDICRRRWRFVLNAVKQTAVMWLRNHPKVGVEQNFARALHISYFVSIDFHIFDPIQRLGAPPGQKEAIERVIGTMQEAVERGERTGGISSAAQLTTLFADYNRKARHYGIDRCLVAGPRLPRPVT